MDSNNQPPQQLSFDQWFAACTERWDMTMGDDTTDYPWLAWREWYEEGLTVEQAVRRANNHVYGWPE